MSVGHQMELFGNARCALMAPHSAGESNAIGLAIVEASRALMEQELEHMEIEDAEAREKIVRLGALINLHPKDRAPVRAEKMTWEQRIEFRDCVDQLANYFYLKCFT